MWKKIQNQLVKDFRKGTYTKEEYEQAQQDAWEQWLKEQYLKTKTIKDRDALIDFYFNKYTVVYTKIRDKLIIGEITTEEYTSQIRGIIIDGFQIGYDLGFARQITETEREVLIEILTNAFDQANKKDIDDLCSKERREIDSFRKHYDNKILLKK